MNKKYRKILIYDSYAMSNKMDTFELSAKKEKSRRRRTRRPSTKKKVSTQIKKEQREILRRRTDILRKEDFWNILNNQFLLKTGTIPYKKDIMPQKTRLGLDFVDVV